MADDNPPERDVKDFEFQQLCKVRVAETPTSLPIDRVQLIVSSSRFGLTFVATGTEFKVFKTEDFRRLGQDHTVDRLQHVITDFPVFATVKATSIITHIALSCDDLTLAVATIQPNVLFIHFYDVRNFSNQVTSSVAPFQRVRLNGSPDASLLDLAWNPAVPSLLVTCLSDGRLDMFEIQDKLVIVVLKANVSKANARCVCWSPKGKQLVAGLADGTLVQFDPELKEKRKWDYPSILPDDSYQALDVAWLSTYTFLVAYISKGADCSDQPQVILINGGKDTPATYVSFEDVCYGTGEERQRKYHFSFVSKWEMVLAGSSNSSEVGIVGKHCENKTSWEHWNLDDNVRAECPLTDDYVDTFPMGTAVDFTSQTPIPKGDSQTFPPSPLLLVLTTDGLIIPYHMIYSHKDTPVITTPQEQLTTTGLRMPLPPAMTEAGPSGSQSGGMKAFGAGSVSASSAASQSEAKPALGAGAASFSFTSTTSAGSVGKTLAFSGTTVSTTPSFTFKPEINATSTPKTASAVSADSTISSAPPNVNLFKPTDTTSTPLNLGLSKGTTQPGTFQFGQPTDASTPKTFTFGAAATDAAPTGFSALAAASTTKPSGIKPFAAQPTSTSAPGFGLLAATGLKPFSVPATTSSFAATKSATAATTTPLTFGSSTNAAAIGAQKPKPSLLGTPTTQPLFGASSLGTSVANTTAAIFGGTTGTTTLAGIGAKPAVSGDPGKTGFTGLGTVKAGTQPPPPPPPTSAPTTREPAVTPQARAKSPVQVAPSDQAALVTASVDNAFSKSISEEIEHFQKEMQDLKKRASGSLFTVGTNDEMVQLKKKAENMYNFWTEIKSTTQDQSKEVEEQRSLCLDMFAMTEECRSREQLSCDPRYSHLLKMQSLDPGSQEKLQQLQLQYQVLDQGIRDVDLILDTQWEEYQQRKKNKTNRVQRPTNDAIYRIVKSNQNIIHAQKSKLKKLEESLKQLKLVNQTSVWQPSTSSTIYDRRNEQTELSTLADSLVNPSARSRSGVQNSTSHSTSTSSINQNQLVRLREHLYRRHVPVVKSTRPENLSMSRLLMPEELFQQRSRNQQSEETAVKSELVPDQVQASAKTHVNVGGLQGRSSPSLKQSAEKSSTKYNLSQAKDPGFTLNQQGGPGFNQNFAGSDINGKLQEMGKAPMPKFQTGFQLNNKPMTAPSVRFDTKKSTVTSTPLGGITGPPSGIGGQITLEDISELQPTILTNVKEINGQTFEDVSPEDSTENDEDYDEDDEYDDEESNGIGFGLEYNLPPDLQEAAVTSSTPVSTRIVKSDASQTPVSRKLFGGDAEVKPVGGSFQFGMDNTMPGTFSFGQLATSGAPATETKKEVAPSKPFVFAPVSSSSTKSTSGFSFSMATSLKQAVEQGGVGGDSADITSSEKEEKEPPVPAETKPGGTGFSFVPNADTLKPVSEVISSDVKTMQPPSSQPAMSLLTASAGTKGPPVLTGLLESKSSSSLEELADEKTASAAASKLVAPTLITAVTETTGQSETPNLVTSTSGNGEARVKPASPVNSGLGQPSSGSPQPADSVSQTTTGGSSSAESLSQPKTPEAAESTSSVGLFSKPVPDHSGTSTGSTLESASLTSQSTVTASSSDISETSTSSSSVAFGQVGTTASASLFGQPAATAVSGGLFGQPTSESSGGLFGKGNPSSGGLFGQSGSSGGLFASPATTSGSSGGLFGTPATTSGSGGLFGTPATTSGSGGLFGTATTATGLGSAFGTTATMSGPGSLFGTATTATGSGGVFGQSATSAASPFGKPGGEGFGQTGTGSGVFGQPSSESASSATASSGGFGAFGSPSGSGFGTATSGPGFGFGQGSPSTGGFGQSPAFGQTPRSGSGFGTTDAGSGGGLFSGLGGKPSAEKAGTNVFGATQTFGSSSQENSGLFGSGGAKSFGTAATSSSGGPFSGGGGTFSGGGGGGSTGFGGLSSGGSGFGSPPSFGGSPAFGGAPKFGSGAAFGGGATFGSGATFGAAPAFGNPAGGSTFGSGGAANTGGFASFASAGSPTFGGLAQASDAPTFGALSQAAGDGGGNVFGGGGGFSSPSFGGQQQNPGFGGSPFGSSPSFSGYRG